MNKGKKKERKERKKYLNFRILNKKKVFGRGRECNVMSVSSSGNHWIKK